MNKREPRIYNPVEYIVFCKTKEKFGDFSNMCGGYPIKINDVEIRTSEALYQSCRFPENSLVQREIILQKSPISAKMKSKKYLKQTRIDWDQHRVLIMRWCLRVKLFQHWEKFQAALMSTEDLAIVEKSTKKDIFWAAILNEENLLFGHNVLGRLLMELRENLKKGQDKLSEDFTNLKTLEIGNFLLMDKQIPDIKRSP